MPTLCRFNDPKGELLDEANVSTQSAPPGQDPRVSRAYEDQGRTQGVEAPSRERPQTADRLSGGLSRRQRLTTSAEFQALFQRGKRIDRPSLIVLWRESTESTRVGFAVSRHLRLAVIEHGLGGGLVVGAWRLARCDPFRPGGWDPPPTRRRAT